jgi:hypothetical protein
MAARARSELGDLTRTLVDLTPLGSVNDIREAWNNPTVVNITIAVVGVIPADRLAVELHHIVAKLARSAQEEREFLRAFDIIAKTDPANLVPLPAEVHRAIHRESYYDWVAAQLRGAETKEEILARLKQMADELRDLKTVEDVNKKFPLKAVNWGFPTYWIPE